jgi:hypothetical protein
MTEPDPGPDTGSTPAPKRSPVDDHLDVDTVADLIENLLPASEAHRARDHVKACPNCQRTYDALIELSADLAEEGRAEIPMPAEVAERLDAVMVSESMLRSSTVGVHSLAQLKGERRKLPRLLLVAATGLVIGAIGVGVLVSVANQSGDNAAGIQPSTRPTALPELTTGQIGVEVQRALEGSPGAVVAGSAQESACATQFASSQPNRALRLVQAAMVEGRRSTVIALQSRSARDVRVYVVTGCDARGATGSDATVVYVTTVTLRSR